MLVAKSRGERFMHGARFQATQTWAAQPGALAWTSRPLGCDRSATPRAACGCV